MITKMRRGKFILISIVLLSFFSCLNLFAADTSTILTFEPAGGTFPSAQTVTIGSYPTGAVIHYTIDNSDPTLTSALNYSQPLNINSNTVIKAVVAYPDGTFSSPQTAEYIINATTSVNAPVIEPGTGTYAVDQRVTMTSTTSGAVIRYTLDGTTPSPTSSPVYSEPISIISDTTIRAIAVLSSSAISSESMAEYTFNRVAPTADITFSPEPGTFANSQTVSINSSLSDTVIHYTLDGTDPTSTSFLTSQPITINSNTVIKAVVAFSNGTFSSPETAEYIIKPVPAPTFTPAAGAYESGQKISLSGTNNAVIRYTTNNTDPTTSSLAYSEPITLSAAMTVKAVAIISGYGHSDIASAAYTIKAPTASSGGDGSSNVSTPIAAAPIFSPAAGAYLSGQKISIKSATSGAVIRYTTDGTAATASSPVYSEPITLSAAMTVKAIAIVSGYKNSEVASAIYTIKAEDVVAKTDTTIAPQAVNDTTTAKEPLKVAETNTQTPTSGTATPPDSGASTQATNTSSSQTGSGATTVAQNDQPEPAQEGTDTLSDKVDSVIDLLDKDQVVKTICSAVNATDIEDCKEIFFKKIADNVTCKDPNMSEEACQNLLKEKYLSALIVLENKYDKIKASTQKIIGENYTSGELENYIDKDANVSGTTVPFQSGNVNVKVLQAIGTVVLDEAQDMIQGAPLAVTVDTDGDGIPDDIEKRIGTDPGKKDTDGDGYDDENEITNGYDPLGEGRKTTELSPIEKILIDNLELQHPLSGGTVDNDFSVDKIVNGDESGDASGAYVISGKAEPNSVATIYIYSDIPVVTTVSTDQYGNWRYEFDQPLTDGDHEIYVAINDDTGKVVNKSNPLSFFVRQARAVSSSEMAGIVSPTDTPSSATNNAMTLYMIIFAVIVAAAGILIFLFVIMQKNKTQQ